MNLLLDIYKCYRLISSDFIRKCFYSTIPNDIKVRSNFFVRICKLPKNASYSCVTSFHIEMFNINYIGRKNRGNISI